MQLLIDLRTETRARLLFYAAMITSFANECVPMSVNIVDDDAAPDPLPQNQGFPQQPQSNVLQFPGVPVAPNSSPNTTASPFAGASCSTPAAFGGQPPQFGASAPNAAASFPNPNSQPGNFSANGAPTTPTNVPSGTLPPFAPGTEVDAKGMPHDVRIHSSGKTKTPAGAWRYKKGVADGIVASVEQELTLRMQGIAVSAAGAPPPSAYSASAGTQPNASFPDPNAAAAAAAFGGGVPMPPQTGGVPQQGGMPNAQAAPTGSVPTTDAFADLMQKQGRLAHAGRLSAEQFDWCVKQAGAQSVSQLYSEPQRCPHVSHLIDQITGGG